MSVSAISPTTPVYQPVTTAAAQPARAKKPDHDGDRDDGVATASAHDVDIKA